jgi:beta-xylosidase
MNPPLPDTTLRPSTTEARTRNEAAVPRLWLPDLGNGHYRNPIIHADYSDPDVIRHGNDFYMTASSFNCTPGLPILHSCDLVNWQLINHAVQNLPHLRYEQVQPGCGIWAPTIRFHDGKFWIFFAMPDEGIYLTTTSDPSGQWSEPHLIQEGKGLIDPCPLWDDDGKAYLIHAYAHSRCGLKDRLKICPLAPDGSQLLGEGRIVFYDPQNHPTVEGPKFLKRGGWYYISAPAGGVATGWQTIMRSRSIYGPYEVKVVLAQGNTSVNGPHQGAIVDTPDDQWWFIHFQDCGAYGRVTHLQPVEWQEGWPLIGVNQNAAGVGEPVRGFVKPNRLMDSAPVIPQTSDNFDSPKLGLQWQWNANHSDDWYSLTARPGWLRLFAQAVPENILAKAPHALMQKFPALEFSATTVVEIPDEPEAGGGLIVLGESYAGIMVRRVEGILIVEQFSRNTELSGNQEFVHETIAGLEGSVWLRVDVKREATCQFSYSTDGRNFTTMGLYFFANAGRWIGAKIGLISVGVESYADFGTFKIQ